MKRTWIDKMNRIGNNVFIDGMKVCMATHPAQQNHSGHARGRVMHLSEDGNLTVCNMKFDGMLSANSFPRKECKICFKRYLTA